MLAFAILLLLAFVSCSAAQAGIPYYTLTVGMDGTLVETQSAYEPVRTMVNFDGETLSKPNDMVLGPDGNLYIADTGNKRILVIAKNGTYVKSIGDKSTLSSPMGVFVDDKLNVYVADEGEKSVLLFDEAGNLIKSYDRPTHPIFGEDMAYKPNKVAVDKIGNLYITSTGNYSGIIKMKADGTFIGYFGANTTKVSFLTAIKKLLYTDEQFARSVPNTIPISIKGLCLDEKGMVYTVSQSTDANAVRRLNVAGNDNLRPEYTIEEPTCIAVSAAGSIIVANAKGEILEMTSEGRLLFLTSATMHSSIRKGLFQGVSGIAVDTDHQLFVLDRMLGNVQVLSPTEFADTVHGAFSLFQNGQYMASKELWTDVKRMNSLFSYASVGLGEALFREGSFQEAMPSFRHGGDKTGYSDAYWEVRADWLHKNLGIVLSAAASAVLLVALLKFIQRKTYVFGPVLKVCDAIGRVTILRQVGYAFCILRNPYDACYGIKREKKAGMLSGTVILLLFFIAYVAQKYYSGFLFKTVRDGTFELLLDAELVALVFGLVAVSCYLVGAVKDGEARFRDIYIGFAYSLIPIIVIFPIATLLSNVLTYNESFIITLLHVIAYAWTGLLFVLSLMFLNDISFKKTVVVIIWSLFTILVMVSVCFIVIVLLNQLIDFIRSIYGEAVYRFVGQG